MEQGTVITDSEMVPLVMSWLKTALMDRMIDGISKKGLRRAWNAYGMEEGAWRRRTIIAYTH